MKATAAGTVTTRPALIDALVENNGNQSRTADALGYADPRTFRKRMASECLQVRRLPCGALLITTKGTR